MENFTERKTPAGLYSPRFEHDNCGIGAVVDIKGRKSHKTIDDALQIVEHLEHRAGKDAEGKTGDGVGILTQISDKFFQKAAAEQGLTLGAEREYGIGMFFFPQDELKRNQAKKLFEIVCKKEVLPFLGWREVPTCPEVLGHKAIACMPSIWQGFVGKPQRVEAGIAFDRRLYVARRVFEQSSPNTYVCSLSSRTIVYKGMFLVKELRLFYPDLQDADYESAIGMVHSRFSTNTSPSWNRAHPNRFILHNGEINTIRGNVDTMLAREETIGSNYLKDDMTKVLPIVNQGGSDSAQLDNTLEFMVMNGMDLPLAVMVTIPEQQVDGPEEARLLPVLCHDAGAVGRPRQHPVQRRRRDGRSAGPQRSAPEPLLHHEGWPPDPFQRGRRARHSRRRGRAQRPSAPRQNAAGGYRQGRAGGR
jgi:glutamate synthase (NADPH/NADH) large chain